MPGRDVHQLVQREEEAALGHDVVGHGVPLLFGLGSAVELGQGSFDCRPRQLTPDQAVILIPLGIVARARSLTRGLLWYLQHHNAMIRIVGSALDGDRESSG
ncbi:hypothetical protein [Streptomyces sp. NPDC096132]|uniref:hypothetical protein n=1 Tax=Streptomyces sp. NPDC096132 TaxID=3366075 RepID=UPI0038235AF6